MIKSILNFVNVLKKKELIYDTFRPKIEKVITKEDLKEGEFICSKCNGGGSYPYKFVKLEDPKYCHCNKCQGTGKLDWIENIVGKKEIYYNDESSSGNITII